VLVLCAPRTGSHLLLDLLNSHPELTCVNEPWASHFASQTCWYEDVYTRGKNVADVKYIEPSQLVGDMLITDRVRRMHLMRDDLTRSMASEIIRRTEASMPPGREPLKFPIYISPTLLVAEISARKKAMAEYEGVSEFTIFYEDFTDGGENVGTFANEPLRKELLDWIGVPDLELSTRKVKKSPTRIEELVENWEEIPEIFYRKDSNHAEKATQPQAQGLQKEA
jgi:hypothetical protein